MTWVQSTCIRCLSRSQSRVNRRSEKVSFHRCQEEEEEEEEDEEEEEEDEEETSDDDASDADDDAADEDADASDETWEKWEANLAVLQQVGLKTALFLAVLYFFRESKGLAVF